MMIELKAGEYYRIVRQVAGLPNETIEGSVCRVDAERGLVLVDIGGYHNSETIHPLAAIVSAEPCTGTPYFETNRRGGK